MEEKTFLSEGNIVVTNTRFIVRVSDLCDELYHFGEDFSVHQGLFGELF